MVQVINETNWSHHLSKIDGMLKDRKRVFVDILKWDIQTDGEYETDQFDNSAAEYLVVCDPVSGEHLGSLRLLQTDRPHILGSIFPHLCGEVPRGDDIREITRLCLSPRLRARQRREVRDRLATALVEYGLLTGIKSYTGVAEIGWLSQILALGWRCRPLGLPQPDGHGLIGALQIFIEPDSIGRLRSAGTYVTSDLQVCERPRAAA